MLNDRRYDRFVLEACRLGLIAGVALLVGCEAPASRSQPVFALRNIYSANQFLPDVSKFASGGQYEVAATTSLDRFTAMHVKVRLDDSQADPQWAPVCAIGLRNDLKRTPIGGLDNRQAPHQIALTLEALYRPDLRARLTITVVSSITPPVSATYGLEEGMPVPKPIDLTIAWLNGRLIVEVDGSKPASVDYRWPISALALTASSGRCRFSGTSLGNIKQNSV